MNTVNRKSSRDRFPFTEEDMADAFEEVLTSRRGIPGIGRLSRAFREIDCHRGRPDFIGVVRGTGGFLKGKGVRAKFAASLIISFLHAKAPRSTEYLRVNSGLS